MKQNADTGSAEFKETIEAGLHCQEDTKNWQAGNGLGEELTQKVENKEPSPVSLFKEPSTPLFMRDRPDGVKGNPQDEKDGTEE